MKINFNTILQVFGLILAGAGFATASGIAPLAIGLILLLGGLSVFGILRMRNEQRGTTTINGLIWGITLLLALNSTGYLGSSSMSSQVDQAQSSLSVPFQQNSNTNVVQANGATASAKWVFYPSNAIGGTYASTGAIYLLDSSFNKGTDEASRYNFMKLLNDGKTGELKAPGGTAQATSMTVSAGAFTKNQLSAQVGQQAVLCGYVDATPAAAENVSFCKPVTLSSVTGGSTPEWMWTFADGGSDLAWRSYATTAWYNYADTAVTGYVETEPSTIEKTFQFSTFPTNNGETIKDAALYIESPSSTAGAITKVKVTSPGGKTVDYTALQSTGQMSSSDPRFTAAPALTTSTDVMYFVGNFPMDTPEAIRTSTTDKSKYNIEVTYNHPATAANTVIFKAVQNSGALSSAGGHFDFGTVLSLNMTNTGTDAWT